MKTLATCKPTEFLQQTNKIRKKVEKWVKDTNILEIRNSLPELKIVPSEATTEERMNIAEQNKITAEKFAREKITKIFDAILDERPEETLEIIALCCFIEPSDIDNHEMGELLDAIAELISNQSVLNFFTSVVLLGQINTSSILKR